MHGRLYRNRWREKLWSIGTHLVMSSISLECPPCEAKSRGVAPSSLGNAKAWIPPGRHRRKWESLARPHLTARCRRDSLCRDTAEKEKHVTSVPLSSQFVSYILSKIQWMHLDIIKMSELYRTTKSTTSQHLTLWIWRGPGICPRSGSQKMPEPGPLITGMMFLSTVYILPLLPLHKQEGHLRKTVSREKPPFGSRYLSVSKIP